MADVLLGRAEGYSWQGKLVGWQDLQVADADLQVGSKYQLGGCNVSS
jgi:hypothetical protein